MGWSRGESQWGEAMKGLGAGPGDLGVGPMGGRSKGGSQLGEAMKAWGRSPMAWGWGLEKGGGSLERANGESP